MSLSRWLRWRSRAELEEEIRAHLELEVQANLDRGFSLDEARLRAKRRFGNVRLVQQRSRDNDLFSGLEIFSKDVSYAARGLLKAPGFTLAALATLALGIGANTAIYQLFDAVLLRSLPVSNPHELVIIEPTNDSSVERRNAGAFYPLSNPVWEEIRNRQDLFEGVVAWGPTRFAPLRLNLDDASPLLEGLFVSGGFFSVLGVEPMLGRTFSPEDDRRGCGLPGAVLGHSFWQRQFGGDPGIVGRTIFINSHSVPVLGVTPPGFSGLDVGRSYDLAVPICSYQTLGAEDGWLDDAGLWWLTVMGRLPAHETGESVDAALAALSPATFQATLPAGLPSDRAENYREVRLNALPGRSGVSGLRSRYGDPLVFLLGTTGLVLLLASTNLASLILARSSARNREFAVRLAIGASSSRLARQSMVESALLAAGGGAVGLVTAMLLSRILLGFFGGGLSLDVPVDAGLLLFLGGSATVALLAFGTIPAVHAARVPPVEAMSDGRNRSSSARGFEFRKALVVSQLALCLVLVFGAVLFGRTLANLAAVDTGFDADGVYVARVDFEAMAIPEGSRMAFKRDVLDRIGAIPGVTSAAEARHVPMGGTGTGIDVWPAGEDSERGETMGFNFTTEDYLETMGTPLLAGRDFRREDIGRPVAIVNPTFARRLGLANPVGRRFRMTGSEVSGAVVAVEIVGLVPDTKYFNTLRGDPFPIAFMPTGVASDGRPYADFMIRSGLGGDAITEEVRRTIAGLGSGVHVDLRPFSDTIRNLLLPERLMAALAGFFGVLAMGVASVGLYGVVSYMVIRRRSEIGVRMALGATRRDILALVLSQSGKLVALGCVLGAILAMAGAGLARSLVFGIEPRSAGTVGAACLLLVLAGVVAACLPAFRAAQVGPNEALRAE